MVLGWSWMERRNVRPPASDKEKLPYHIFWKNKRYIRVTARAMGERKSVKRDNLNAVSAEADESAASEATRAMAMSFKVALRRFLDVRTHPAAATARRIPEFARRDQVQKVMFSGPVIERWAPLKTP